MIADKVKAQTSTYHRELEAILVRKIKSIRSVQDYIQILNDFYSFFAGLELLISKHLQPTLADAGERRKTAAIADDLSYFKAKVPDLATGAELPVILNHFQALGALYVIEGSTLGGKYISQMISQQLNIPVDEGLSFFNGYGESTMEMWARFKDYLNKEAIADEQQADVIEAANQTFLKFKDWVNLS
ncbi:heme oxygenase [Pedobacter sp. AK017]|uniref:biliverdin-producing heme oxygenase n=1 Tax=Pedobacter sp. AK017 TaxID=2723073 RepID=UPI00161A1346|nr:biliverdin-producing heme oxygenase [Pedobacter sp. AK017]MBB5438890.1 heme oxygenase [Pedobacter sp. AK017]